MPEIFNDRLDMAMAAEVIEEARLRMEVALRPTPERERAWREVRGRLLEASRPMCFELDHADNYQVAAERDFVSLCALLLREGVAEPAERPALEFYLHVQLLRDKNRPRGGASPRWDGNADNL